MINRYDNIHTGLEKLAARVDNPRLVYKDLYGSEGGVKDYSNFTDKDLRVIMQKRKSDFRDLYPVLGAATGLTVGGTAGAAGAVKGLLENIRLSHKGKSTNLGSMGNRLKAAKRGGLRGLGVGSAVGTAAGLLIANLVGRDLRKGDSYKNLQKELSRRGINERSLKASDIQPETLKKMF